MAGFSPAVSWFTLFSRFEFYRINISPFSEILPASCDDLRLRTFFFIMMKQKAYLSSTLWLTFF